jgi:hypothetical protein
VFAILVLFHVVSRPLEIECGGARERAFGAYVQWPIR